MKDARIDVDTAGAGAAAALPGETPPGQTEITIQKVDEVIHVRADGRPILALPLREAVRFADLIWEAVRS